MKLFYIIIPALILSRIAFTQGSCSTTAIESPNVAQPTGTGITSATCSNLVVKWQGSTGQTYCVNARYFNPTTSTWVTVNGTPNCISQNCTSTLTIIPGVLVTWSVQAISSGYASYPVTSVLEYPVNACTGSGVSFCGKVLLQAPYDTATKKMSNTLNTASILQTQVHKHPYSAAPFNYTGKDSVRPGFFAAYTDVADWVLVELRNPNAPSLIVGQKAAFVKQDGTLVDTSGTNTNLFFPGVAAGNYYVAVRHRNHLGVLTRYPMDFSSAACCYDFTKSLSLAYKGAAALPNDQLAVLVPAPSIYGIYGGDANTDAVVRKTGATASNNDYLALLAAISSTLPPGTTNVYRSEDLNMDGNVRKTGSTAATNDYLKLLNILGTRNAIQQPSF